MKKNVSILNEYIGIPFIYFTSHKEIKEYIKEQKIILQTRLDIEDIVSSTFVNDIHKMYIEHKDEAHNTFIIDSHPVLYD